MHQQFTSPTGVRFLALMREGKGLKPSARAVGIDKGVGYRWLRDEYLRFRSEGLDHGQAQAQLGFASSKAEEWKEWFLTHDGRHHLQLDLTVEEQFWASYSTGMSLKGAGASVGLKHTTVYRWVYRRFVELRRHSALGQVTKDLRLSFNTAARWEAQNKKEIEAEKARVQQLDRDAIRAARVIAERVAAPLSPAQKRRVLREVRYWDLVGSGASNAAACRMLGVSRTIGTRYRSQRAARPRASTKPPSGRYLCLRERLQMADLLRMGCSLRAIGRELGRHPSTIKRELDRHRDIKGRYLPHVANHDASRQRLRPRERKLSASPHLRSLVQAKLTSHWSPEQICGWLSLRFPTNPGLRLCPETIYQALLFHDHGGLQMEGKPRLRTGRKIRKHRWRTGPGRDPVVQNMTMISDRPAVVETRTEAGHWEGDLIIGPGSISAMVTLRERKTHYGIVINLPYGHTAALTNHAIITALAGLPAHLKRTLTWDQGVEMARHQELAQATGLQIYFAERSSPWQRGANENFNGLVRQFFPKGTDLSVHSADRVREVCGELNTRPRKSLGYRTPAAVLHAEMEGVSRLRRV
ncbi:IS30 family transposase [Arthrobacter cheniae]|uniref:IS30 family transposase n=1 Tax=Arthrobacter cheniae TaxID=1258888 RepID=A0A3A5M1E6_9MICC|nr:IS30 family transposase [Arthrobacter cheniae]RJT75422.1 IS30 family transposase [Arthrobacter cheniae]